jgi:2-iminobutanoate/2-iminopropanoate deaminase
VADAARIAGMNAKAVGPYSPIVRAGDWLVVSGQIGIVDGKLVTGGVQAELRQAVANLRVLLEGAGAALADVAKTTLFLRHIDDYAAVNEAYVGAFGDHRPARSAVAVAGLPLGALVEVEAWAFKKEEG